MLLKFRRFFALWLLPFVLMACGGQGCTGCSAQTSEKKVPLPLLLPAAAQFRLTQHGFDVVAGQIVALMKLVLGSNGNGVAVLDAQKLLGVNSLNFGGGLGIFNGNASLRDLVLTLDLQSMTVQLVNGSSPARIRITLDHAQIGVDKGIIAGGASVLGLSTDAACHLANGLDLGKKNPHLATMSATLDLVLGVDAKGQLDIQVSIDKPVLHDIGFVLQKDCALTECTDQVLLEDPCLECELCNTGKLASDALATLKSVLEPILSELLKTVGNILVKQVLGKALNGKPLDVELPLDAQQILLKLGPLGALLGETGPFYVRGKPTAQAFVVVDKGLQGRLDAAFFAPASPAVADAGEDATTVFAKLPQSPAPPLPIAMQQILPSGQVLTQTLDLALMLAKNLIEETLWSVLRSGLLNIGIESRQLYEVSGGKLLLSAGVLDLLLPGVRGLSSNNAPLRITTLPSAKPEHAPLVQMAQDPSGKTVLNAQIRDFAVALELQVRGRWLTVLELQTDLTAQLSLRLVQGKLALSVDSVQVPKVTVTSDSLFAHADLKDIAPAVAQLAVTLLLSKPLTIDLDVQAMLEQTLQLPLKAQVVGVQTAGNAADWLVIGATLGAKSAGGAP